MNVRRVLPRDAIPSVDDPSFGNDYFGEPEDDVLVLEREGEARAYPVRVLDFHEVVNDSVGGRPVAVTWCPLCGAGVVYDREVTAAAAESDGDARTGNESTDGPSPSSGGSGRDATGAPEGTAGTEETEETVLSFGVSGKLADDDLVMYDRETGSEWKQSTGRAIAGPLSGTELRVLPAGMTTYGEFRESHPEGVVLQRPGGESEAASDTDEPAPIDYGRRPYESYLEGDGVGLGAHRGTGGRAWDREDLHPKAVVLGVEEGDVALGFPRPRLLAAGGVGSATVGERDVVAFATPDGVHGFEDPGLRFEPVGGGRFRADGTVWDGTTGRSEDGRRLERVPARRLFAFTWQDDHGPDAFWTG